jgi:peroxiredoxin
MKRTTAASLSSILLSALAVVFTLSNQAIIAASLAIIATLAAFYGMKKETAIWQLFTSILAAAVLGYAISIAENSFHPLICLLLLAMLLTTRPLFYTQLTFTGLPWIEPLLLILAVGVYLIGNIHFSSGWMGWAFPAPVLLFNIFKTVGTLIDYKEFKKAEHWHYAADVGKPAPHFSLADQDGNMVSLSDYKGKRHVLLIFVRGDWCPTCHIMLRTYEKHKNKFAEKNIIVMAIGPDPVGVNRDMVIRIGIDYKLLSDDKREAAKMYGTQMQDNNPMTKYLDGIPLPASFLVDISGMIVYTSNPKQAGQILYPDTIFPVIDALTAVKV